MGGRYVHDDFDPLMFEPARLFWAGRYEEAYELVAPHSGRPPGNVAAAALIALGRYRRARRRLRRMDPDAEVNHALVAALLWARGRREEAWALYANLPGEHVATMGVFTMALVVLRSGGDVVELFGDAPDVRTVDGVGIALFQAGRLVESATWFEERCRTPLHAYNAACGWSHARDAERGLRALERAASLGYSDGVGADLDEDLAFLRAHPGWAAVRARLGAPAPPH